MELERLAVEVLCRAVACHERAYPHCKCNCLACASDLCPRDISRHTVAAALGMACSDTCLDQIRNAVEGEAGSSRNFPQRLKTVEGFIYISGGHGKLD